MVRSDRALVVVLLGAVACGGGDGSGADAGNGDGGGADSGIPSTVNPSNRFALESLDWAVPGSGFDDGFVQPSSATSYRYWTTFDVDGDRRPDIVQTGATDLSQSAWDAAGSPYWKVYRGGDERWSAAAMQWKVPASGGSSGFFATSDSGWQTFDLTGDGLPDLVQTADPATSYVWDLGGDPFWKVFVNDGEGGFAKQPMNWPVPDSGTSYGFHTPRYASSTWHWATMDIDGDRRADLVQTADPATGTIWDETGAPHWKVFRNTGDGFDREATVWSVPGSGTTGGFYTPVANTTYHWLIVDLDDDGHADLVQTADPATGSVWDVAGEPYWKLFAGEESGFAASPDEWSVPPNGLGEGFYDASSSSAYRRWSVIDIDGDRDLDLVQTGDVSHDYRVWDASGDPYWKVWRNTGAGFSAELYRWPVPRSGTEYGFFHAEFANQYMSWILLDADADGHPDLIETMDPSTGMVWDATGSPYWKIFRGVE